jgi:pyruvate/2-oxoglutarate dehydrogenase complex dihydrolipoamide acyltransferase (E2) component
MIPVTVPQLSISMEEGKVLRWLVEDGAEVRSGEPIVEIETDKATVEVEAPAEGRVRIVAAEGEVLAVEAAIAERQRARGADHGQGSRSGGVRTGRTATRADARAPRRRHRQYHGELAADPAHPHRG